MIKSGKNFWNKVKILEIKLLKKLNQKFLKIKI